MAPKQRDRVRPDVAGHLPSESPPLRDDAELAHLALSGDYSDLDVSLVEIVGCRIEQAQLTGSRLARCRLIDCVVIACDLSGVFFEDCTVTRVEFHGCRLSGLQATGTTFIDVGMFDCKIVDANFRMTNWKRAEFEHCDLATADFYSAVLPDTSFERCDLTGVQLAKADLRGSRLNGSKLEGLQGADGLQGVTIGSDQIIPAALAVFAAMNIRINDVVS